MHDIKDCSFTHMLPFGSLCTLLTVLTDLTLLGK